MAEITPMMHQYLRIKEQHSDCILFFRLGDFYEMFNDDARLASKELDLTLTTRDRSKEDPEERVPMCGIPYHSSEAYIARLIAKGYKVAICEQTEDPALAKGLVDREVIRIVTPGTVIDSSMLEEGRSNYICSVSISPDGSAVCFADISTGEICATSAADTAHIINEIGRFSPAETVLDDGAESSTGLRSFLRERIGCLTEISPERFNYEQSVTRICEQFKVQSVDCLGLGEDRAAVSCVGALLSYLKDTQKTDLSHINSLDFYSEGRYMELDIQTIRSLELAMSLRSGEKKGSLLWVLDKTKTPMGSRLMRSWLSRPLLSTSVIKRRQAAISVLFSDSVARSEIILALREIGDMERLIGKIVYGSANCRDMASLSASMGVLPRIAELIKPLKSAMLRNITAMDLLADIKEHIDRTVGDNPPFSVREGGMIREGCSEEVDHLRSLLANSSGAMADIEAREKARTGKKLKVGYNRVFGYYIEIPRSMSGDVPDDYIRKQTLVNCERFITQELKELETELLTAKDRLTALEYSIFTELRESVANEVLRIQKTAQAVAEADVLSSLAFVAAKQDYCPPEVDLSSVLEIRDGRHPVVEIMQTDSLFVPNDVFLDGEDCRTAIITGPNMAGKSTYMRQTALIVLMAQIGSFVPAKSARIGLVDRVFTRIGASDDLSAGKSTFMVEMTEVAEILKNATAKSLLILDEIGRGTSTYDGMAIARAVLEYCSDRKKLGAKTLFATHYHELTALEDQLQGVKNFNISAKKRDGDIIFLRKIVPGGADDSYGIEVAGLAGVPDSVIKRARAVLKSLESDSPVPGTAKPRRAPVSEQVSLLDIQGSEITEALRRVDLNTLTPIEAMNFLFDLKKKL
ncbi:MAG: DNA mismatch repair protein MutS [Oscillospiraceae bacterium]